MKPEDLEELLRPSMANLLVAALQGEDAVVFMMKYILASLEREMGPSRFSRCVTEYLAARTTPTGRSGRVGASPEEGRE